MTIQDARERAQKIIATVQQRAESLTEGEGVVAVQLRRALASEPALAAKAKLSTALERVQAIDVAAYKAQVNGYKDEAIKAATARWESFSATRVGVQVKAAQAKVTDLAKRFTPAAE